MCEWSDFKVRPTRQKKQSLNDTVKYSYNVMQKLQKYLISKYCIVIRATFSDTTFLDKEGKIIELFQLITDI